MSLLFIECFAVPGTLYILLQRATNTAKWILDLFYIRGSMANPLPETQGGKVEEPQLESRSLCRTQRCLHFTLLPVESLRNQRKFVLSSCWLVGEKPSQQVDFFSSFLFPPLIYWIFFFNLSKIYVN